MHYCVFTVGKHVRTFTVGKHVRRYITYTYYYDICATFSAMII